ncbi:hypothetical protein K443DRAFT_15640 [Laccaria amethystina LaAM-08-1]|uniref:Uncharacterized protein n=1 Tax=Laccaria amethystina LaAM-08-1 TaxID=1095629 RepID=A0A0C9X041_9AGAR|nr:hypothetical protein K443DRAFT_15640 [Laccaria amethystina LaAM-08-1]
MNTNDTTTAQKRIRPPTNEDGRPNDNKCPPPTNRHPRYNIRCHVADSDMANKRRTMTNVIVCRCCAFYDATVSIPPTFVPTPLADNGSYVATTNNMHHKQTTSSTPSTNGNEGPGRPDTNSDDRPAAPPTNGDDRLHHHLMNGDEQLHHHLMNGDAPCTTPPMAMTAPHPHL